MPRAKKTKASVIREYLSKHGDEMGPAALAQVIMKDHPSLKVRPQQISTMKSRLKAQANGAAQAKVQGGSQKAGAGGGIARHLANLKEAARALGKEEAKQILDLF